MDKLRIVKGIVLIMTFFLISGTLVLLNIIYKKSSQPAPLLNDLSLQQPKGSNIAEIHTNDGLLFILVKGGGRSDRIIAYNPNTQQTIYTINID